MPRLIVATLILVAVCAAANAHHSRAPFQLDKTVVLDAKVKNVSWSNPHVYFIGSVVNEKGQVEEWTFEGHSISGLVRLGWTKNTLKAGDVVKVVVNPHRDPSKKFALVDHVVMADGVKYYSAGTSPQSATRPVVEPSKDFSGNWRYKFPGTPAEVRARILAGPQPPSLDQPFTEKGRAQAKAYKESDNPAYSCGPISLPYLLMTVYEYKWIRQADRILIKKEQQEHADRVIYLKATARPAGYKPNSLGHSVGRFEADGTLVVETTGFNAVRWGGGYGIDSSDQKRIVERYKLSNDGMSLSLSYTFEDPVYFTKPVTAQGEFAKTPNVEFVDQACDPQAARRHLQYD